MIKLAAWTSVAAVAAAFGFGGVSAEAHSPAGYCASHPSHTHCPPTPPDTGGYPIIGNFAAPFVDLQTNEEVDGKAAINSYGLYLIETTGLTPNTNYSVCIVATEVYPGEEGTSQPIVINQHLVTKQTDGDGNLSTDGRLNAVLGTTIVGPTFQIHLTDSDACNDLMVQESGLAFVDPDPLDP